MQQQTRNAIKSVLEPLGLADLARGLRDRVNAFRSQRVLARHRDETEFVTEIEGATLRFSLDDPYSRGWFLPRYAGGKLHERSVTMLMAEEQRKSRCFVDVGTNLGWFTCLASKMMPEGRVYGFEMDDGNFTLVQRNLQLNHCDNVEVHHLAVSDAAGKVSYVRQENSPSSVFRMSPTASANDDGTVTVQAVSLDEFFRDAAVQPDLMKIDVEGAEMLALRGMTDLLESAAPTLFVEVHPADLPSFGSNAFEVVKFLCDRGYSLWEILDMREQSDTRLRPVSPDEPLDRNCMLFARRE
jgi:FkbM family methyltransferase